MGSAGSGGFWPLVLSADGLEMHKIPWNAIMGVLHFRLSAVSKSGWKEWSL